MDSKMTSNLKQQYQNTYLDGIIKKDHMRQIVIKHIVNLKECKYV